jgi:RNA polymerase sigma-70 factor (ECF subfamily)
VSQARAGSTLAFSILVDRHEPAILAYLFRLTGDREAAADLTQETFLVAWRKLRQAPESLSFRAWLHGIALNEARSFRRRQRLRRFIALDAVVDRLSSWVGHGPNPLDAVHERELIQATLDRLPARYREALLLHSLSGVSVNEMAGILGLSVGATRALVARARQQFTLVYRELSRGVDPVDRQGGAT